MVHRSRFCALFFDSPDALASVAFWSAALGRTTRPGDGDGPYFGLLPRPGESIDVVIQEIDEAPRAHIDIETDNVEAEASRLMAIGAELVAAVEDWKVLRAPGGHLFCVVPAHTSAWPDGCVEWSD